jgi:hypothetical protein
MCNLEEFLSFFKYQKSSSFNDKNHGKSKLAVESFGDFLAISTIVFNLEKYPQRNK